MASRIEGTYLRFFVHENRRHGSTLLYEWLLERAKAMGIHGGTVFRAVAGFGRHGVIREERFFELAGEVAMRLDFLVTREECQRLLQLVEDEQLVIPYAELPAVYGVTGGGG